MPPPDNAFRRYRLHVILVASAILGATTQRASAQTCGDGATGVALTEPLEPTTIERIINERFAALLTASSTAVPGSFASIDMKEADVTFAASTATTSGVVGVAKASGGVTEGILSALKNQTASPKFGAELQLHRLGNAGRAIQIDAASCDAYYAATRKARNDYALRTVEIDRGYLQILQKADIAVQERKIAKIDTLLGTASGYVRDSLNVERAKAEMVKSQVAARSIPDPSTQLLAAGNQKADELVAAGKLLEVLGYSLNWLSVSYHVNNTEFRLFNPAAVLDSQTTKHSYVSHGGGVVFSHYSLSYGSNETRFWSIGAHMSWENNLGSLSKLDVTERKTYGTNPTETITEKKVTAYKGGYKKDSKTLRVIGDYYRFFFFENQGAIHLFPAITGASGTAPAYSTGIGLLMSARKGGTTDTFVNAELYYNLTDVINNQHANKGLLGRSDLGLRFTFPITFSPRA